MLGTVRGDRAVPPQGQPGGGAVGRRQLGPKIPAIVSARLKRSGIKISTGTIVDATNISAPGSTKNRDGERDPEMRQTAKGPQWNSA